MRKYKMIKPHLLVEYFRNDFTIKVFTPAILKNGFYRGVKVLVSKNDEAQEFTLNSTYPINYDNKNGYSGMDAGDSAEINQRLDKMDLLLEQSENGLDIELVQKIKKAVTHVT